jgi:hypothetical protein
MTLKFEQQAQSPDNSIVGEANPPSHEGNVGQSEQAPYKRVTAEEAATLPYDELKRRMKEERRLYEEGLLPATEVQSDEGDGGDHGNLEGNEARTAGQDDSTDGTRSGGEGGDTAAQGDPALQKLLQQAQERNAQLEREARESQQRAQKEREERERNDLQAQHQRVEEAIGRLPQQQQELARRDYMNRLGQRALNDYYGFLQTREQQIRQAEIVHARREIPSMLGELADSVAQRHGLRNADSLKQYVTSKEFKELLDAANTEDALTAVAANAGQWMEFLAVQQATQNAQQREARRQKAAANPPVQRDTPLGGVPTAGGDMDLVRRINTMTKEEFFKWKKDQLRAAQASA